MASHLDADAGSDTDADADADAGSESDAESDPDADAESDPDADPESDAESDADADADADPERYGVPWIAFFCFVPLVPRATRVAFHFTTPLAFAAVDVLRCFGVSKPSS